mmetsp:Transcript_69476/g.194847  ORF Transcript_69476/g.194847 Transcript_69476/m.194847 type:complete len:101 (-) Transcript_69476:136-438(-)
MFKRFFGKKKGQSKAATDKPAEEQAKPAEPPKIAEKVEEVKAAAEEKAREVVEQAGEAKEAIEEAMKDGKCKVWLMDNIFCCLKREEAAKAGAVTDMADV